MSARDELLRAILGTRHMTALHLQVPADIVEHVASGIADAILAAGYTKPRTITTAEELDALPVGSVVRSRTEVVFEKAVFHEEPEFPFWLSTGLNREYAGTAVSLPATVIHEPAP